ncbi:acyl-CoA dehydrogenase family protein [Streptomyces sp. DSM 44917]|uniref:Acyl-CoA dehydrogenase family protein n=1 Tax=Streptomyces boetiae TaxID=3075541 RepID=A0ABU2LBG4_9ACTN|nr:acyl-CoA dehydrogenase family protein [Streptomyces sp. DSM 44917]MDT0308862.1 acyl-CoA dehydrogenase family protein [Streptomyces sp. DSM 44917]
MTTHPTPAAAPGDDLESRLGDPFDEDNPVGFAAVVAADERAEPLEAGERLLDAWQFNHELVPRSLGGRWGGTDALTRRLRPVFRRDPALGLGYGVASLTGAATVWAAGSAAQRLATADALLAGERIAAAFHEPHHGNGLPGAGFTARADGDGLILSGAEEVIANVERASSLVLLAHGEDAPGADSVSALLVSQRDLKGSARHLPRFATSGLRACPFGGIEVDAAPVGPEALVGAPGQGLEAALRACQVTRAVLPGLAVGVLDTALHLTHDFAADRVLYGLHVSELPHARATLAAAFTDVLIADSLATAVSRQLHLAPGAASAPAAAVGYLVPLLLEEALHELSIVLGARSYLRTGRHAAFSKFYSDLPLLGLAGLGPAPGLLTILPQLPSLARDSWSAAEPPAGLFDTSAELPGLDVSRLSVTGVAPDPLMGTLAGVPAGEGPEGLPAADLAGLREECLRLSPAELGPEAGPESFALARRYAVLLAAAACVGTHGSGTGFLGERPWLAAALTRLAGRLGHGDGLLTEELAEPLFEELTARVDQRLSCDLARTPVFR